MKTATITVHHGRRLRHIIGDGTTGLGSRISMRSSRWVSANCQQLHARTYAFAILKCWDDVLNGFVVPGKYRIFSRRLNSLMFFTYPSTDRAVSGPMPCVYSLVIATYLALIRPSSHLSMPPVTAYTSCLAPGSSRVGRTTFGTLSLGRLPDVCDRKRKKNKKGLWDHLDHHITHR